MPESNVYVCISFSWLVKICGRNKRFRITDPCGEGSYYLFLKSKFQIIVHNNLCNWWIKHSSTLRLTNQSVPGKICADSVSTCFARNPPQWWLRFDSDMTQGTTLNHSQQSLLGIIVLIIRTRWNWNTFSLSFHKPIKSWKITQQLADTAQFSDNLYKLMNDKDGWLGHK